MLLKPLSTAGSIYAYAPPSFCMIDGEGGDGEAAGVRSKLQALLNDAKVIQAEQKRREAGALGG